MAEAATIQKTEIYQTAYAELESLRLIEAAFEPELPVYISVPELESDRLTRHRAAGFIGRVMANHTVEAAEELKLEKPISSLRDGIHWAAQGDVDGVNLVDTNVVTDMIERTLKKGHVMDPVPLKVTPDGKIVQYNQTGDAIQTNSLQLSGNHPVLGPRTKAEATNHHRDEDLQRAGWYEDYSKLVISPAEDVPEIFYTDSMSCSLQLVGKNGNDLQLESAFVAGIAEAGYGCHDIEIIIKIGDMVGIDFRGKTRAEIIATPILIHNSLVSNGVIDVVENLWDTAASQVNGRPVFFGESKEKPCSYPAYLERCRERTKTFQPKAVLVREQLIREASQIKTREQAIERLHALSEEQMVEKAIEDYSIDPQVFGSSAAKDIMMARYYEEQGMATQANAHKRQAIKTADSKSCPWARSNSNETEDTGSNPGSDSESELDCDFISKKCPECGHKDVKTRSRSLGKGKGRRVTGSCGCSKTYA